ncbi:hypothetical protein GCM10010245_66500 [Streptomyces spectabilis]|nr:hypothetical protein GCM10010245_66500 [Streptomyces spectabilis]
MLQVHTSTPVPASDETSAPAGACLPLCSRVPQEACHGRPVDGTHVNRVLGLRAVPAGYAVLLGTGPCRPLHVRPGPGEWWAGFQGLFGPISGDLFPLKIS